MAGSKRFLQLVQRPEGFKYPILSGGNLINTFTEKDVDGFIDAEKAKRSNTFTTTEIMLDHFLLNKENAKEYLMGLIASRERERGKRKRKLR